MELDTKKIDDIVLWAQEKKAEDIIAVNVSEKASFTDCFIVCSANGSMHTQAVAENILEKAKLNNYRLLGKEGISNGKWILLDYGDVIVHIFDAPLREHYDLEKLWNKLPEREK